MPTEKKYHDVEYLALVKRILENGVKKGDRTGTGTISLPFQQMRFDLSNNSIPLLTTKKMFTKGIIYELLWYIKGLTNIEYLTQNNVHIWDEWADEDGELGPIYGAQWRKWKTARYANIDYRSDPPKARIHYEEIDQLAQVIHQLRTNPNDRRMIVSAWNVGEVGEMALPPCHLLFQFWTDGEKDLRCHLYQRSCDVGLGVPFNIVQYSILTHMIAHVVGMEAKEFVWTGGDTHIYNNHIEHLSDQISRTPFPSPTLQLNKRVNEINEFIYHDFNIEGYEHHPSIKMEVSV